MTVGIDDYHLPKEVSGKEDEEPPSTQTPVAVDFYDSTEDFDLVVSKLEIYVIRDISIFEKDYSINGVQANLTHPSQIKKKNEKWIDLKGD